MSRFLSFSEVRCCFCFNFPYPPPPQIPCLAVSRIILHQSVFIIFIVEFVFILYFLCHLAITGCECCSLFHIFQFPLPFNIPVFFFCTDVHKHFGTDIVLFSSPSRYRGQERCVHDMHTMLCFVNCKRFSIQYFG